MAQQKFFVKNFESFRGLDLSKSVLGRDSNYAFECSNLELDLNMSLKEIDGFKVAASTLKEARYTAGGKYCCETGPRFGLKRFVYQDNTTGETKEELIGVGNGLWKLARGTFTITGPANSYFQCFNSGSSNYTRCWVGTSIIRQSIWSGSDSTYTAGSRLADLVIDINTNLGGAGWSTSLTPRAVVNGLQAGIAKTNNVTVSAGHTVSLSGRTTPLRIPASVYYPGGTTPIVMWMDVISTGATTLTLQAFNTTSRLEGLAINTTFDTTTGHEFGVGNFPVYSLTTTNKTSCSSALTIQFYYWEQIYCSNISGSLLLASNHSWDDETSRTWYPQMQNFTAENMSNCLFVGSPISLWQDPNNFNLDTGLVKYDGTSFYLAGLPTPTAPTLNLVAAAAGMDDGTYKYLYQYKHVDPRGNITYSNSSLINGELSVTCSNGAANNKVTINHSTGTAATAGSAPIKFGRAGVNGATTLLTGTASRTITINAAHGLRVGELAGYIDRTSAKYRRRKILSVTATTVTLEFLTTDGTETLNNLDTISIGISIEIYRTKANGQTYYFLWEKPTTTIATTTHDDTTLDSGLGFEWDGPHTGERRRDMPPPGALVTTHQGKLVVGGWSKEPNSLGWSGTESCEYFSRSTNSTDLASTAQGPVTAMASAGSDVLLCWKERSLLTVVGDFYSGAVYTAQSQDGDVGCPSATGWCRVRDQLVWMSPIGLRAWKDGQIADFGDRIRARLPTSVPTQLLSTSWDSSGLLARRAVAYNDPYNQRAIFFVPYEQTSILAINEWKPTLSSRFFVWDYKNDFIAEWTNGASVTSPLNAAGGIEFYSNEMFMLGRNKVDYQDYLMSYLFVQRFNESVYDSASLSVQWEFLQEPSFPKDFLSLKLWKVNDPNYYAYRMTVKVYDDFSTTTYDTMTYDFVSGQIWNEAPLPKHNRAAIAFNFTSAGAWFRLTGYELVVAAPFRKERTDFEP